jgi:hypothetical protein
MIQLSQISHYNTGTRLIETRVTKAQTKGENMKMHQTHGPFRNGELENEIFTQPCTHENEITYEYFCLREGLADPRCAKVERCNGTYSCHLRKY